jgi:hypothetical protein
VSRPRLSTGCYLSEIRRTTGMAELSGLSHAEAYVGSRARLDPNLCAGCRSICVATWSPARKAAPLLLLGNGIRGAGFGILEVDILAGRRLRKPWDRVSTCLARVVEFARRANDSGPVRGTRGAISHRPPSFPLNFYFARNSMWSKVLLAPMACGAMLAGN